MADFGRKLREEIAGYILEGGTFGFQGRNRYPARLRMVAERRGERSFARRLFRLFFPDYGTMAELAGYAFVRGRPWLLHAASFLRLFRHAKARGWRGSLRAMRRMFAGESEMQRQQELMSEIFEN